MNILHTIAGGPVGGAERFFVDLAAAMARAGHATRAVMRPNAGRAALLACAGVPFETGRFGRWGDVMTPWRIRRAARAMGAQAVLAWMGRAARATPPGRYARVARLGGYYNLSAFRGYDALICNTPDLVRYAVEGGFDPARVHFIPNFATPDPAPAVSRADLDTPPGAFVLLAMGRLHPAKAMDVSLRALARLPDDTVLWIAGEGPEEAALRKLARELGVAARVRWLGWRDDPGPLLKAADLCVFPSRVEPFGNVIIQAWVHGTPVITADATGPAWLVRDGEDALLIPREDDAALARAITRLRDDPALARAMAARGQARGLEEFSEAACVARYLGVLEDAALARRDAAATAPARAMNSALDISRDGRG